MCATLERHDIHVVLSGGSVVTIYSDNAYQSYDLDFIQTGLARRVDGAMRALGFERTGRHWTHPASRYWVEFPPGPVQVGERVVTEFAERATTFGTLRLLAPTECVMDRLAAWFHWNDPQGLEQAVAVALRNVIDLERIEAWSRQEGATTKYRNFRARLANRE